MSQTKEEPVVVKAADDEPDSVRTTSARTKGLLICVPILLGLGFLLGYPALVVVGLAPVLLVAIALFMVGRRPGGNLRRAVEPTQLTRGETATAVITSVNNRVTPTGVVEAIDSIGGQPVDLLIPPVPPRREITVTYKFVPLKRGELHLGPVTLERRDPWGLFVRRATASATMSLLVHPRVLPVEISLAGNRIGQEGGTADRDVLGSNQFHTLREYVIGDELRQIHWRSSARVGKLMVKQLVDNPLPRALVLLDNDIRSYLTPEDFEEAVDAAASIGTAIVQAGLPVALRTTGEDAAVEILRADDITRLLDALALSDPRVLKVSPPALRQILLATRSTSFFLVTGPRTGLLPSAIAALGLVGEGTIVRMGQEGGLTRPRRGLVFRDVLRCEDLGIPMTPGGRA
ncbi:MAG: DUF58 domain-containing protein [Candidatus Nanopelagicales bacterium]|jgi:uncharacterized protein (DUF58 family)|nr:DUF58 domain-containing protein [Candidatus Nanopelagicales bacterium]